MEKKFKITVDGREYIVKVEDITEGESLLYPQPGSMQVPSAGASVTPAESSPAAAAPAAGAGDEVSPLAGTVHSIDVEIGQEIRAGDQIASVEAMKMKTPVVAKRDGKVTHIMVKAGDVVDAGQPILTLG